MDAGVPATLDFLKRGTAGVFQVPLTGVVLAAFSIAGEDHLRQIFSQGTKLVFFCRRRQDGQTSGNSVSGNTTLGTGNASAPVIHLCVQGNCRWPDLSAKNLSQSWRVVRHIFWECNLFPTDC